MQVNKYHIKEITLRARTQIDIGERLELDASYPQILDHPKFSKYKSEYDSHHLPHEQTFLAIPCMCVHEMEHD